MPVAWTQDSLTKFFDIRGDYLQRKVALASNANVKRGDILVMTSGAVNQAISLPGSNNSASSAASTAPYGVALEDKNQANGDTHVQVAIFNDDLDIALRIYNATGSDAEAQDLTVGTKYQYHRYRGANASTWFYVLATTTSSTPPFQFVEPHLGNNAGDDYGVVWVKPIRTAVQEGV